MSCFVINLESAVDRRQAMMQQLQVLGIPFEIFPAVDGRKMTEDELARQYDSLRAAREREKMTRAEIGCALSHLAIYRKMVDENIPHALILEDDAELSADLKIILEQLQARYSTGSEIVVLLSHVPKYLKRSQIPLTPNRSLAWTYGLCWNAHGYFITQQAARRMLQNLYPVWIVADHWLRFQELGIVAVRALVPYCIGLRAAAEVSSIGVRGDKQNDLVGRLRRCRDRYWHGKLPHYLYRRIIRLYSRSLATLTGNVVYQQKTW